LSKHGNLFVWGSNSRGQLGIDNKLFKEKKVFYPLKVCFDQEKGKEPTFQNEVYISTCGSWNTAFVKTDENLLTIYGNESNPNYIKKINLSS